ncbi:DUF6171 family protein [Novisyntrophococcus fermenticellae]|uniref:DUF6171 family protein n=1 Tax=Novisyntrophococcus fermenticellae TaxID=2068655 RepID=UPI001E2AC264|nr:DUF6171 family protein [Novisyntrophococcus fermenticellae]
MAVCKRCLLYEQAENPKYRNLLDYIDRIPKAEKVADDVYHARREVCKSCDYLLEGMCRLCGCYVELRAAMKTKPCPHVPEKW